MGRKRNYVDMKYKFIRYLLDYEKHQRRFNYLKAAAEWTSRAIVSLELHDGYIKSVKQAQQLEAIGGNIADKLKSAINADVDVEPPPEADALYKVLMEYEPEEVGEKREGKGQYLSSAGALLVGLYDLSEEQRNLDPANDTPLIKHDDLREYAQGICQENFLEPSSSFGVSVLCPAWWRINILESRLYVKKRTREKEPVYHLQPLGVEIAERLKGKAVLFQDLDKKGAADRVNDETAVYSTDDGSDGVLLKVDHREYGGDNGKLVQIYNMLKQRQICFKTCQLNVGDYCWFHRVGGVEQQLPVIVERKRGDDLAESIKDGRYRNQLHRMKGKKNDLTFHGEEVQLVYILESNIQKYVVPCEHECVGKCGNPSLLQVMEVVSNLENDPEITLVYTDNIEKTIEYIANVTTELQIRVDTGSLNSRNNPSLRKPKPVGNRNNPSPRKRKIDNRADDDNDTKIVTNLNNLFQSQEIIENRIEDNRPSFVPRPCISEEKSSNKKFKASYSYTLTSPGKASPSSSPRKPKINKHELHRSINEQLENLQKSEKEHRSTYKTESESNSFLSDLTYSNYRHLQNSDSQDSEFDLPSVSFINKSNIAVKNTSIKKESTENIELLSSISRLVTKDRDNKSFAAVHHVDISDSGNQDRTQVYDITDNSDDPSACTSYSEDCKILYLDELAHLKSIFPNKEVEELEKLLIDKCGNIELCVDVLL